MSTTPIVVQIGRDTKVTVSLGFDVSADTFTSQVRVNRGQDSQLIATWTVEFITDGSDGEILLTMPKAQTENLTFLKGWMDIKRASGGEELSVFAEPVPVVFRRTVTE